MDSSKVRLGKESIKLAEIRGDIRYMDVRVVCKDACENKDMELIKFLRENTTRNFSEYIYMYSSEEFCFEVVKKYRDLASPLYAKLHGKENTLEFCRKITLTDEIRIACASGDVEFLKKHMRSSSLCIPKLLLEYERFSAFEALENKNSSYTRLFDCCLTTLNVTAMEFLIKRVERLEVSPDLFGEVEDAEVVDLLFDKVEDKDLLASAACYNNNVVIVKKLISSGFKNFTDIHVTNTALDGNVEVLELIWHASQNLDELFLDCCRYATTYLCIKFLKDKVSSDVIEKGLAIARNEKNQYIEELLK